MTNLKESLLKEQSRLEKILRKAEKQLKDAPQGTMRLSSSKKQVQYYHCMPGEKKNGRYLPKTEEQLIQRLAQKSYDEKVVKLAGKRLAQIRKITRDYEEDEIEKLFSDEHIERKKLISPIIPTWEQRVEKWVSEDYIGKEFQEGTPVILTEKGERVRSKSEKILADYFYRNKIAYKYESPLHLKGY